MSALNPSSWLDKLVGASLSLLIGAAAIYVAVRLIQAVWTALLVIIGVGTFVALSVTFLRARARRW